MKDTKNDGDSGQTGRRGVGAMAKARRLELELFDAAQRKREEARRRKREELLRIVKEAEARAKRQATNARLASNQRLKFVLGGLALAQLRAGGLAGLRLTSADLEHLPEKDRQSLDAVLADLSGAPTGEPAGTGNSRSDGSEIDILL